MTRRANPSRGEVPEHVVEAIRQICDALPGTVEEPAWTGVRWRTGKHTYAHVVHIENGWPTAYAREAGTPGPADVLTVRAADLDLDALSAIGFPFFRPAWGTTWNPGVLGVILTAATNWDEIAELIGDSHNLYRSTH
ncbi:MAG: MmcQ/YjbR family DNA-binding protein [Acidimicrobiales bacterium]